MAGTGARADRRSEAPKAERERSVPASVLFLWADAGQRIRPEVCQQAGKGVRATTLEGCSRPTVGVVPASIFRHRAGCIKVIRSPGPQLHTEVRAQGQLPDRVPQDLLMVLHLRLFSLAGKLNPKLNPGNMSRANPQENISMFRRPASPGMCVSYAVILHNLHTGCVSIEGSSVFSQKRTVVTRGAETCAPSPELDCPLNDTALNYDTQHNTLPSGRAGARNIEIPIALSLSAAILSADSRNLPYRKTHVALSRRICKVSEWTEWSGLTFRIRAGKYPDVYRRSNPLGFWRTNFATDASSLSTDLSVAYLSVWAFSAYPFCSFYPCLQINCATSNNSPRDFTCIHQFLLHLHKNFFNDINYANFVFRQLGIAGDIIKSSNSLYRASKNWEFLSEGINVASPCYVPSARTGLARARCIFSLRYPNAFWPECYRVPCFFMPRPGDANIHHHTPGNMSPSQSQTNTLCSVDPRSAGFAVVSVNTDQIFDNQPRMPHYPGRVRGICIRVKLRQNICRDLPAPIFSDTNRFGKSGQPIESSSGFGHQHVLRDTGAVHEVIWYCHTVGVMYAAPVFLLPVDSMGIQTPKKLSPLEPGLQCQPIIFWVGGAGPINLRPVFYTPAPGNRRDDSGGLFPRTASVQCGRSFHKLLFGLIDPTSGLAATSHPAARLRPLHSLTGADLIHANRLSDDPCGSDYDNHSRPRLSFVNLITGAVSLPNSSCVELRHTCETAPVFHNPESSHWLTGELSLVFVTTAGCYKRSVSRLRPAYPLTVAWLPQHILFHTRLVSRSRSGGL